MMKLEIADIPIGIYNKHEFTDWSSLGYETERVPLLKVSATESEIEKEYNRIASKFDIVQAERNILYQKICFGMLDYDGFLLHASVVAVDGEAYAFTAPSGTGKSTHTGYWMQVFGSRAQMVNGDKPIIRHIGGQFYACGTPWRGKEHQGAAIIAPLKALCLLERGKENAIVRATDNDVIDKIFHQIPVPWEAHYVERQLDLLNRLVKEIPIYKLKCNMSPEAAITAYNGIRSDIKEL